MPNFEQSRRQLQAERECARALRLRQSSQSNQLKRTNLRKSNLQRTDPQGRSKAAISLEGRREELIAGIATGRREQAALADNLNLAAEAYLPFSDPREHLGQMRDDVPILMLPLRLETRFKILTEEAGNRHQLWVRAYPDSCLIDTFEELPSEAEYLRTRAFWIALYRAGQLADGASEELQADVRNRRLGAWQQLLEQSSSGRAYWLTQELQTSAGQEPPVRETVDDIFLIIPTASGGPIADQKAALRTYYTAIWRSQGDPAAITEAANNLVAAVGNDDAAVSLLERYFPAGLPDDDPRQALPDQKVEVLFLDFPEEEEVDRTLTAWSEPARANMLPDRLVLQGFKHGKLVVNEIGRLIPQPLVIGPDPGEDIEAVLQEAFPDRFVEGETIADEEKAALYVEYLSSRADTRWLYDFARAEAVGMAFRVDLDRADYFAGFDRLFVAGVRLSRDAAESQQDLEQLLAHHQYGTAGLAFLPQGLATNRTEDEESPYTQFESAEASFDRLINAAEGPPEDTGSETRVDGRWFTDLLGIDPENSGLHTAAYFKHTDQCESLAMQRLLFPATLGSYLESMMSPLIDEWEQEVTDVFFSGHVRPRGRMPIVRIDKQPYGILPVSGKTKGAWLNSEFTETDNFRIQGLSDHAPTLERILTLLNNVRTDWAPFLANVPHLPRPSGDPHQNLLDVLGLHGGSVEFDQRMGETITQFFNRLKVGGIGGIIIAILLGGGYLNRSKELFARHGIDLDALLVGGDDQEPQGLPKIMKLLFFANFSPLTGSLIDDQPLSEFNAIRAYTADDKNYIEWLEDAMLNDPKRLRNQSGFLPNDRPKAMLYQLLRHATELRASNTGLDLYRNTGLITNQEARELRVDQDFVGVRQDIGNAVESRYELLYRAENRITNTEGNPLIIDHLATLLRVPALTPASWGKHHRALQHIAQIPTARLERLMAEHIDCCNYRLDAWLQGFTDLQLYGMRYGSALQEDGQEDWRSGIYLGAYGWVENLLPQDRSRTAADLDDSQRAIFAPNEAAPEVDSSNAGFVHAPSLDHAATAAVLRNAYLSQSSREDPDYYSVNLSSERVRMAMQIIEGLQAGQELGELLGYQLERGMHDRNTLALDQYIYPLRTSFPLRANRQTDTQLEEDELDSIEQIAASNVVDGLWLLERIRDENLQYPWTARGLPAAGSNEANAIIAEVERITNINDAVADLSLAESVHQVVKGNYDRAAGTLNAFSKGGVPSLPEVVKTPRRGTQLTQRLALHLEVGAASPGGILNQTEPAIGSWLTNLLPAANEIGVRVQLEPINGAAIERTVRLDQLGWTSLDLLYQLDREGNLQLGALDEPIQHFIWEDETPSPGTVIKILYTKPMPAGELPDVPVSCFELVPLLHDLRQLLIASRPLRPTDLRLPAEADKAQDTNLTIDVNSYAAVKTALQAIIQDVESMGITPLTAANVNLEDLPAMQPHYTQIKDNIDTWIRTSAGLATRLQDFRPLNAHSDFAYSGRHSLYRFQRDLMAGFRQDLNKLLLSADELLVAADAAPEEERLAILKKVEPLVATTFISIEDVTAFRIEVGSKRDDFAAYLDDIQSFLTTDQSDLKTQIDAIDQLLEPGRLSGLTSRTLDMSEARSRLLVVAQDLLRAAAELVAKAQIVIDEGDALLAKAETLPPSWPAFEQLRGAVRKLLGEDFQLLPRFVLSSKSFEELEIAWADRAQLLKYQQDTLSEPFPVDSWLHGLARVRPFAGHWERSMLFSEDYDGASPLNLEPLQFPYRTEDSWLGLEFPEDYALDEERLLYTAHYAEAPNTNSFCGLLLGEWTEVIPARKEDTGLTFHFDRPNNEPPQTWLLALPENFNGAWQWSDLIGCMHEALDLAQLRAIEPKTFEQTAYSHLLPTTVATVTSSAVTTQLNYAAVNGVELNVINPNLDATS